MKRCPQCRRDYHDETLLYCLDDGARLLDGPAFEEPETAVFSLPDAPTVRIESDRVTGDASLSASADRKGGHRWSGRHTKVFITAAAILAVLAGTAYYYNAYYYNSAGSVNDLSSRPATPESPPRLYWEMPETEQLDFIARRARHVQTLIGDEPSDLDGEAVRAIKIGIDDYVEEKDSLSQKPFDEGLRVIYGRASQYAPLVAGAFESHKVPGALGIYQAMVESEYHDCPAHEHPTGPVGLFQFTRKTAAEYGLKPEDYCNIEKQSDAAARLMSDLLSDFGSEKSSWTLALLSFNIGEKGVREYLREMRSRGVTERNYWALLRDRKIATASEDPESLDYVPRFFAAAIIGETPPAFDLSTPPLTTLKK